MIAKGSQRANAEELADHLLDVESGNEEVLVRPSPWAPTGATLHEALALLEADAVGSQGRKPLFHCSISPPEGEAPLTEDEWARTWRIYEEAHNLTGHKFVEVFHYKKRDGSNEPSEHRHRVYSRVVPDLEIGATPRLVNMSFTHIKNEYAMAQARLEMGRPFIPGAHGATVAKWAREAGNEALAEYVSSAPSVTRKGTISIEAHQSAQKAGRSAKNDYEYIYNSWSFAGGDKAEFMGMLRRSGLTVERGDKGLICRALGTGVQYSLQRVLSAGAKVATHERMSAADARAEIDAVFGDGADLRKFEPDDLWRQASEDPQRLVADWLTRRESTFDRAALERRLAELEPPSEAEAQALAARVLAARGVVAIGEDRWTTVEMRDLEADMVARAVRMGGERDRLAGVEAVEAAIAGQDAKLKAAGYGIGEDQAQAVRDVLDGRRLALIEGFAGAGKSTTMQAVAAAVRAEGGRIIGCAPSGKAAAELAKGVGEAVTIAATLKRIEGGQLKLTRRDMLVVDEAGMIGSRDMAALLEAVDKAGARAVLLGDTRQLQAVAAGGAMRAIVRASDPDQIIRLTTVVRQKEPWMREASKLFNSGDTARALKMYERRDALIFSGPSMMRNPSDAERSAALRDGAQATRNRLIADWSRDLERGGSSIILAHKRADVASLNIAARDLWRARLAARSDEPALELRVEIEVRAKETLAGEADVVIAQRNFRTGDRVIFTRNDRDVGVKNGELGTLTVREDGLFSVLRDGADAPSVFDPKQFKAFDYGWASTIHSSQGVTVDRAYALASRTLDQHLTLVAATRHREQFGLYVNRAEFADRKALAKFASREAFKETSVEIADKPATQASFQSQEKPKMSEAKPEAVAEEASRNAAQQATDATRESAKRVADAEAQRVERERLAREDRERREREDRQRHAYAEAQRLAAERAAALQNVPADGGFLARQGITADVQRMAGVRYDAQGGAHVQHVARYWDAPEPCPCGYEVMREGRAPSAMAGGQRGVASFGGAEGYQTIVVTRDAREAMAYASLSDSSEHGRTLYISTGGDPSDYGRQHLADLAREHPGAIFVMAHSQTPGGERDAAELTQLVAAERARIGAQPGVERHAPPVEHVRDKGQTREARTWSDQAAAEAGAVERVEAPEQDRERSRGLDI